jgi:hypothetical protein
MEGRDWRCGTWLQPYTEINRQKSSGKINDPVASGEARAGRVVGAAGGCGKVNSIQTVQVKSQKSERNIQRTFKNSYRFDRRSDTLSR